MKSRFSTFPVYVFLTAAFFSCTAPVDINTRDSEPVIVIYGCLSDEHKNQSVRITSSSPYFDDKENGLVTDADVRIKDSEGHDYTLLYGENGYYFSDAGFDVRPGVTYHLIVNVDFDKDGTEETYEAVTTVLPLFTVDSINVKPVTIMGYRHFSLNIYMQDSPETKDFYLFRFYVNDTLTNSRISDYVVANDEFINGSYVENAIYYFEDNTDKNAVKKNEDDDSPFNEDYTVSPGDGIRLQILNIEEGYYTFINECSTEMRGQNPMFGGPPSNISTNLSGGAATGFFTGYCIHEKTAVVPGSFKE
ncbi:MAG: DUF4249 domain-containing protein [Tannerella sp.]|jgi:hypothetical protein|nr:DUF4249 domain-containing protein [Tannerella sp.]